MNYPPWSSDAAITAADLVLAVDTSIWTENIAGASEGAVVVRIEAAFLAVSIRAADETGSKISGASAFAFIRQILVGAASWRADFVFTASTPVGAENVAGATERAVIVVSKAFFLAVCVRTGRQANC